jgi:hypothetical protein
MNKLDMKPIDEALKTHYAEKSLSDSQLDQLMAMQTAAVEEQSLATPETPTKATDGAKNFISRFFPDFRGSRYAFYATACMLLACLVVTFSLINQPPLSERIMDEIAYNHKQDMPIEVASSSLEEIRQYLDKLSFPIISPAALGKPNWEFLGGRYCSINGKLAAQLKLKNLADNTTYTLYQAATKGGDEVTETARSTEIIDGVGVSIWREKGLLLGLASSP